MTERAVHPVNTSAFFYDERHALTKYSALKILGILKNQFGPLTSVLDVGCGVGTWLYSAQEINAGTAICGVEGPWLNDVTNLPIPRSSILTRNLEQPWELAENYSLSICLEVAEHLTEASGKRLVQQLCGASPLVLFSAAIPGQGGNGHINEQWPDYWQHLFSKHAFRAIDCVRPIIWNDDKVPWWYRQNIFVYAAPPVAKRYYERLAQTCAEDDVPLLGVVNPSAKEAAPAKKGILKRAMRRVIR